MDTVRRYVDVAYRDALGPSESRADGVAITPENLDGLAQSFDLAAADPEATFDGMLWAGYAGAIQVMRYVGTSPRMVRRPHHIGDVMTSQLRLIMPIRGGACGVQGDREFTVHAGQAAAVRFDQPFTVTGYPPTIETAEFFVPVDHLSVWGIDPDVVAGRSWDLTGSGLTARDLLINTLAHNATLDTEKGARMSELLVRAALLIIDDAHPGATSLDTADAVLRRRALELIEARYCDPDLTPAAIAGALHVSSRTLFRAFETSPMTIARLLLQKRLSVAALVLENDRDDPTVASIADVHGFHNPDHFTRAFRAKYGMSPSEYRAHRRE